MINKAEMTLRMASGAGFIAALDQSGGSTPSALRQYGISDNAYHGDTEMFRLVHEMRVRIVTSPAFTSQKLIAAILFEGTMDATVRGKPTPTYLWQERGIVPIVKVDKGLESESDAVQLMKPMPDLDILLERAIGLGVYGTKMRSVINGPSRAGIAMIVDQQFDVADKIASFGLMPIIEPEVSIKVSDKDSAERLLLDALHRRLEALPVDRKVMLKLTIPTTPDLYAQLIAHPKVLRVVALSGGYSRQQAISLLARNHQMIASFSRALIDDLRVSMSDLEFDATLAKAIDEIYQASVQKD